ncbi:hypothetical protein I2492_01225 [Budviciaceae bacterium CWB-B4]|uniref:StbB n=1 Tax=Limnobaculum xujianqingii TaxID=2738837 RepID=A0A9D7AFA5_9GAMM|nr:StbB family protein [Limnobaculum xujianqingii]MBK5071636.1 hypothetical protein [Limnobaculum xujianqingii]MBK5174945.1 hypothetical protein [Limnobaculum xujianqingii]
MIIAVINFSGNVGKTTIARHLLAPRLEGAEVIPIESINADEIENDYSLRGKQYGALQQYLATVEHAVIDVGASNVEDFMTLMQQYCGSHDDFDYFVVPTVPALKQQQDTIMTIAELATLGVPASKIRLLCNQATRQEELPSLYSGVYGYYLKEHAFTLNPAAIMYENELYSRLKTTGASIVQLLADTTDYKAAIRNTDDANEKQQLAYRLATRRLALGVAGELDAAFTALIQ